MLEKTRKRAMPWKRLEDAWGAVAEAARELRQAQTKVEEAEVRLATALSARTMRSFSPPTWWRLPIRAGSAGNGCCGP
jgi:hypothetical protein